MSLIGRGGHSRSRARRVLAAWLAALFAFAPFAERGTVVGANGAPMVTSAAADLAALAPSRHAASVVQLHHSIILNELSRLAESKPGLPEGKPPLPGVEQHQLELSLVSGQLAWNGFTVGLLAHRIDTASQPPTGPPV